MRTRTADITSTEPLLGESREANVDYDALHKFVQKHGGPLQIFAAGEEVVILKDGSHSDHSIIEKATKFIHKGVAYSREEFERLLMSGE
jgi:hypothetical protein